jgi:hypothetical protein
MNYPGFSLNLEAYHKMNMGKVYYIGQEKIQQGLRIVEYSKFSGEELNRGVDAFLQYRTGFFKHLISYSLSESMERIDGVNNYAYFSSFDHQLHRLRLTEVIKFHNWTASINWQYSSGLPFLSAESEYQQLVIGQLPEYNQLDISLVKQFDFKLFYADIGVTILNVLNNENLINVRNFKISEGRNEYSVKTTTSSTAFSPLFFINLRYE